MSKASKAHPDGRRHASLKMLAEYLDLSPSTISFVLNNTPGRSIPMATRERIRAAAAKFNYRPSMIARTLQGKPMHAIGVMLPELGEGYHSQVLSGVGDFLISQGYFYFTVHHRHNKEMVSVYPDLLRTRGVDGILAIDTHLETTPSLPAVLVAGHTSLPDVTNVVLDHQIAADLAVQHLHDLGHRKIAFIRGQPFSADSDIRWEATEKAAVAMGFEVNEELIVRLQLDSHSPEISYPGIRKLIRSGQTFTAVLCFNDVSAMGSIRALHEAGLRVPEDVSILGFDDIQSAAYQVPSLTTIRQPLQKMGSTAAQVLLKKIANEETPELVQVKPELVIRESTGPARSTAKIARARMKTGAGAR